MPLLLLVVAGIVLVAATSYVTLGWILIGLGLGLTLLWMLVFSTFVAALFNASKKW